MTGQGESKTLCALLLGVVSVPAWYLGWLATSVYLEWSTKLGDILLQA
jgi:hypothetical protein